MPAEIPEQLGRYRILRKLGAGGMGAVFLAMDTTLHREVALKLPLHQDNPTILQRFLREARVAAKLFHPNLCPILDVGDWNGLPYFVMPLIPGQALSASLGKRWQPTAAVDLVRKVAQAVGVLHQSGIVHRDLKPHNIMLKDDHEPVVMDFGLAHIASDTQAKLTRTGAIMGTPGYMAPEQWLSAGQLIGPCSDVYSLGVILYELLTAELPSVDPSRMYAEGCADDPKQMCHAQGADVDARLSKICLRAIAPNPKHRYGTMAEFAEALGGWRGSVPDQAATALPSPALKSNARATPATASARQRLRSSADPDETAVYGGPSTRGSLGTEKRGRPLLHRLQATPAARYAVLAFMLASVILVVALVFAIRPLFRGRSSDGSGSQPIARNSESGTATESGSGSHNSDSEESSSAGSGNGSVATSSSGSDRKSGSPGSDSIVQLIELPGSGALELDLGAGGKIVLNKIPAKGKTFWMGSPLGETQRMPIEIQHQVELTHDYYLGVHAVTQRQYRAITGKNPSYFRADSFWKEGSDKVAGLETDDFPVEFVSWMQARDFCRDLTARLKGGGYEFQLPTEAQWEFACRAGDTRKDTAPFYFKERAFKLDGSMANFGAEFPYGEAETRKSLGRPCKIGTFSPNGFGLYDMHGNVFQWCADYYDPNFYKSSKREDPVCEEADPENPFWRVIRGGSWFNNGNLCRAAYRSGFRENDSYKTYGFRVCGVKSR